MKKQVFLVLMLFLLYGCTDKKNTNLNSEENQENISIDYSGPSL